MPRPHLLVLATCLAASACTSPWLGGDARIHVSGQPAVIPSDQLPRLRAMWSAASIDVARSSGFSESYWLSAMDLIARMSSSSATPCDRLQLLSVSPRPAAEFVLRAGQGDGAAQTVAPTRVEAWQLDACGAQRTVRVFDDRLKPDMKVGVTGAGGP